MNRPAELMAGAAGYTFPGAAHLVAVLQPGRRTIVASGEDPLVPDEHRSYLVPEAGGSPGHNGGNLHEVLIQMRPVEERHQPTYCPSG
jgi:hypothetical protein